MRSDMSKVLVESPRGGWRVKRRLGRPLRSLEDSPRQEGYGRGRTKWLGENLGALKKYLARQVGRPWNKVFSEMRAHIKPGNTVQEHVLTHIEHFLHREVEKVAPSLETPCGVRVKPHGRGWPASGLAEGDLYVDPDDGLIKRARRRLKGPAPRAARPDDAPIRLANGNVMFVRNGRWRTGRVEDGEDLPAVSHELSARSRRFFGLKNAH